MKHDTAVKALAGLAQDSRLATFRLLVQRGPKGMNPGDVAAKLKLPPATLSFHLKELTNAGLIKARQEGRFIYYAPDFGVMNSLVGYLTENCCGGESCDDECAPTRVKEKAA